MGSHTPFQVLIVGAGLGGLSCAISCLKEGLSVTILEKAKEIGEIGAGIQLPPNATRVMSHYNLIPQIEAAGAVCSPGQRLLDYATGRLIIARPGPEWSLKQFGFYWYVIHRADYHAVLLAEARRLGATIHLDCDVVTINNSTPSVTLVDGTVYNANVVIGADGLRSSIRTTILGYQVSPVETGDMAFRITIPRAKISALNSPFWDQVLADAAPRIWIGPESHVVCYPVRNRQIWNVVLLRPDDLPPDVPTADADIAEMKAAFEGWDPNLREVLTCVERCLKWKICHMDELETWTRGKVALLGDACHPTLPYQAQGAAMAVEDGAVLGILLGGVAGRKSWSEGKTDPDSDTDIDAGTETEEILHLYEDLRKKRTTLNVRGAVDMAHLFQMRDGPEQERRNRELEEADLHDPDSGCRWQWANLGYQRDLLGFDTIAVAREGLREWEMGKGKGGVSGFEVGLG